MAIEAAVAERLRKQLSVERHAQLDALTALVDAVTLAGEQVQDQRFVILENPRLPETDLVVDIFLSLAFEVVAPLAVQHLMRAATARLVGWRFSRGPLVPTRERARTTSRDETSDTSSIVAALRQQRDVGNAPVRSIATDDTTRAYWKELPDGLRELPEGLVDPSGVTNVALGAAEDRLRDGIRARTGATAGRLGSDSPGTVVLKSVFNFRRRQTRAVNEVFDDYDRSVSSGAITEREVRILEGMLEECRSHRIASQPDVEVMSRFFETCIWKLIYPVVADPETRIQDLGIEKEVILVYTEYRRLRVNPDLVEYWLARLPHPRGNGLQTWADKAWELPDAAGPSPDRPSLLSPEGRGFESRTVVPPRAWHTLLDYFDSMGNTMSTIESTLNAAVPKVYESASP